MSTATLPAADSGVVGDNFGYILILSAAAALGGFLFGFDSGVINGTVEGLQVALQSDSVGTGFNVASMLLGCAVGAFFAGNLADRFGRRRLLLLRPGGSTPDSWLNLPWRLRQSQASSLFRRRLCQVEMMPLKRGQKGARFGFVFLGQGHKLCCFSGLGIGLETERTGIAGTDPGTDHGIGRGEIDLETAIETGHVTVAVGGTGIATGTGTTGRRGQTSTADRPHG